MKAFFNFRIQNQIEYPGFTCFNKASDRFSIKL
jgi:hypothetical protein